MKINATNQHGQQVEAYVSDDSLIVSAYTDSLSHDDPPFRVVVLALMRYGRAMCENKLAFISQQDFDFFAAHVGKTIAEAVKP